MAQTQWLDIELTVDTNAYAVGDSLAGKLTITGSPLGHAACLLTNVVLMSHDSESPTYELWLFDADPSAATLTANSAFALTDADREKAIDVIALQSAFTDANGRTYVASGLSTPLNKTTIYAAIVVRGAAITFTAADDAHLRLGMQVS